MIIKDLGAVSAYAYAVEKGYTGTEEEFAELMASYATVAEEAAESAESASASATSASASAQTATTKASEASTSATQASASATSANQSAQTATTKASEASASASTAGTKASEASASASTASTKASEASASATAAQTAQGLAEVARDDAIDAKTDAETARDLAQQYAESIDPDNIYSAYPTDTASGAVATFTDGADNIPMKSVKVAIEPVQDLHGYDHPWPAGGGKNLFNSTLLSESSSWVNLTISVKPDTVYTMSTNKPSGTGLALYFNNDNTAGGSSVSLVSAEHPVTVTSTSEGNVYVSHRRSSGEDLFSNYQFQIEEGSTATDYAPYSNICPISGFTGCEVVKAGKNLLDGTFVNMAVARRADGAVVKRNSAYRGLYARVVSGYTYTISRQAIETNRFRVSATIDEPEDEVPARELATNSTYDSLYSITVTVPEGYNYLFVYLSNESETCTPDNYQIELGSTATDYAPYAGNTYSITFPSEAGTVYGGTLDVTNGVLTVDRAMETLSGMSCGKSSSLSYATFYATPSNAMTSGQTVTLVKSSTWLGLPQQQISQNEDNYVWGSSSDGTIRIKDTACESYTANEFKTAFADAQLCYKLATPITYTLTPTEIKSLLGDNNIWADAGDTEVTYRADTKLYIDKKIAEVINALT